MKGKLGQAYAQAKMEKTMGEFKKGSLNIGKSGKKVKNRLQAVAIALNQIKGKKV